MDTFENGLGKDEVEPETLLPETLLTDTPADIPPEVVEEEEDEEEVVEDKEPPTYDEAFPPLGGGVVSPTPSGSYGASKRVGPAVRTKSITVVFHIPAEELNKSSTGDYSSLIKFVTADTQTSIEITSSRDGSITVMVCGKAHNVNDAKVKLQKELQTAAEGRISIPKDHHKNIIGKSRANLMKLEKETGTKIEIPAQQNDSSVIVIRGTKEGIARAMHKMKIISEEQFSNYRDTVVLPRKFFPWITGGNGSPRLKNLNMQCGCVIHVPPIAYSDSNEVVVCGEKDKVVHTIAYLESECNKMEENFSNIQVEVREPQHKYIKGKSGAGIQEIFDKTDIWVEMPTDASTTIKLLGLEDKLSGALSLVFEKANSIKTAEIDCPFWLMKFVIGKGGVNIKKLSQDYPKSNISCNEKKNLITIDAPPEELEGVRKNINDLVDELKARNAREVVKINHKLHKHLIGKAGANINKIKKETDVNIKIPPSGEDDEPDDEIIIIGPPEGVVKAREMLLEQASKMENEGSAELDIEQKWHRIMIGQKGENIQKIRTQFPEVQVSFPNSSDKSKAADKVTLRGPKEDVAKVSVIMKRNLKEIIVENYAMKVPILKQHHRYIIGKAGVNIRKIKEETNTRIDLPSETDVSNMIIITGRKEDVDAARFKLLAIQSELEGIYEEEVKIDPKLHNNLIGSKGRIIRALIEESGDVQIRFPSADRPSENVVIRGIKDDVLKAKEKLLSLAHEKELESYCVEIECKTEYHRFLIGRKGINVNKLRSQYGCNIVFPREDEKEQDTIMIIGRKEGVDGCAGELKKTIKELENTMDDEVQIDKDFFKRLATRSNINDWENEFGGIKIVPKPKVNSVLMSGPKNCVIAARAKLEEMIEELQAQVETMIVIPNQYHRDIIGQQGKNVKNVTGDYQVQISFPEYKREARRDQRRPPSREIHELPVNGTAEDEGVEEESVKEPADPQDIIRIVGRPENCEGAKAALLALVPISENVPVPFEYHRFVIGAKGEAIRKMMDQHNVNIQVPPPIKKINFIIVRGITDKVQACKEQLLQDVKKFDDEKEDRVLKSFKLNLTVDHRHHPKIIGKKGSVVNKIRDDFDVNVQFPGSNSVEQDLITIMGYEKNTEEARDVIMKIVSELEERVKEELDIDPRVHARLIGQRGKSIRKVMEKFGVDIRFPVDGGSTITIEGNENNVEETKDHLLELAEEYMDAVLERAQHQDEMNQYVRHTSQAAAAPPQAGFFVRGAPWQANKPPPPQANTAQVAPDTSDNMAFPSLGGAPTVSTTSWGWNKDKSWK